MSSETNLYWALAQTIEWIYGLTHIEYAIREIAMAPTPGQQKGVFSYQITTDTKRLPRIKHPLGLVVESIHLFITGVCNGRDDLATRLSSEGSTVVDLELLDKFTLRQDQGGFATVNVQCRLGLFDGGEKSISRHFIFRNNMLNAVR